MDNTLNIPLNSRKLLLFLVGSILFVVGGIFFIIEPENFTHSHRIYSPETIVFIGISSILFFGLIGILIIQKIIKNKPALTINTQGIIDQSNASSIGFIKWEDIKKISNSDKFISIKLKDPNHYISQIKNPFLKQLVKANYRFSGSLVNITKTSLKTDPNEVIKILQEKLDSTKN